MRKLCALFVFALVLVVPVMAGEIGTPGIVPPPPPPPAASTDTTAQLPEQTVDDLTGRALTDVLLTLLTLV